MCILGPHFSAYDITAADLRLAAEFGLVASMHMDAGFARLAPDGIYRMRDDRLIDCLIGGLLIVGERCGARD